MSLIAVPETERNAADLILGVVVGRHRLERATDQAPPLTELGS